MSLRQKEYLSIGLGLAGAVLGIAASKMGWGTGAVHAALAVVIVGIALRYAWHRCPHCGKHLGRHWEQSCPGCWKWIGCDADRSE